MPTQSKMIVFVAVLASLLEIIDTSIVNVALPTMMGNLGATLEDISMVITGYAIANAIVLPLSAWLGERIGRRKYYLGCIIAFTVTSVACGLAPNLFTLIVFRIFQGLMGGALLPTSQTLIYEQFPKEKAGMAGAIFGMSVMIGPALGPVMGGYLTDNFGWRSIFNINLPLGLIAIFVGMICIFDRPRDVAATTAPKKLDIWGLTFLTLGIGCLQYVLERGESEDWFASSFIVINTMVFSSCLPLFVWWELRVKDPIMNLRLFKQPIVTYGVLLMGAVGFFLYGVVFILPVFVARVFHYNATQTGELFIPGSILTAMLMPFIGKQMQAGRNPKLLIFIGLFSIEICLFIMTGFSSQTSHAEMMSALYVRGFGMAFLFVPINSSILSQFQGMDLGQVSGMLNLFRQIGGSMGIAMIATLLTKTSHQNYLDLSSKISAFDPAAVQNRFSTTAGLSQKLGDMMGMATPLEASVRALYFRVQNQVFLMSFIQLLWTMMFVFGLSFLALWRLQLKRKVAVIADAH